MKIKASLFAAAMLMGFAPMTVYADTAETAAEETAETFKTEDGLYSYTILDDGTVSLYKFLPTDHQGELVIPSEIDGRAVTYIDNACFLTTYSLTSVTIPASVADMGESVFFGCNSLESFTVEEGNPYFTAEDGVLFANEEQYLMCYPAAKADESYTIPDTVTEIAPSAFAYAVNLKHTEIPEGVAFIDGWAFSYSGITEIVLPDSLQEIYDYAFAYCTALASVDLGGVQTIYNASFAFCEQLTEITLPDSLTTIGQYAFAGTGMKTVTIPSSVEEIDYCAFGYDADLSPVSGFTIYGEANSMAQSYANASDEDNDYANSFNFVAINAEETAAPIVEANTDNADNTDEPSAETPAESKGVDPLMIVLAACGGVIVVLAAVLGALVMKKQKHKDDQKGEDA